MNTEVIEPKVIETALSEYSPTAQALAELTHRFKGVVFDLSTTKGDREARAGRLELVKLRTSLEAKRKELKAPALERSRLIDEEAKRITTAILELETPIDQQIKTEETRKEAEREAKRKVEAERVARHQAKIADIRAAATGYAAEGSVVLTEAIAQVQALEVGEAQYEEFAAAAAKAKDETLEALCALRAGAVAREAEAKRLAEERAEFERQRAEQEARDKAEAERVAAEQARIAKEQEAERLRIAAEAEEVAQARLAEEARAAESRRLAEEAAARVEAEAAAARKAADDKAAAERAEADRIAAEKRAQEQARIDAQAAELKRAQDAQREAEEATQKAAKSAADAKAEAEALARTKLQAAAPKLRDALANLVAACRAIGADVDLAEADDALKATA